MLDILNTQSQSAAGWLRLQQELHAAGVALRLYETPSGPAAGGLSLRVNAREQCVSHITKLLSKLRRHMQDGIPLSLAITNIAGGDTSENELCRICEQVRQSVDPQLLSSGLVGTSIQSHQLPLRAYQLICDALLGDGPRYVILDSLQMQQHSNQRVQEETDNNWRYLWNQRGNPAPLLPAYAASIRPASPLLASEATGSVLPAFGIPVPGNTAWLPLQLHLPHFADGGGALHWPELEQTLETCVAVGDQLLDQVAWSTPAQASDARQNRRLAILLTGIGDLVRQSGTDPGELRCLRQISATLARIRARVRALSGDVARQHGPLPALLQSDPSSHWSDTAQRHNWRRRWHAALETSSVRNRNLLVLSPYSVLPADCGDSAQYTDLLPVLEYADAISFANPPDFAGWTFREFKHFHRRAWAIIQRQDAPSVVAAGV